MHEPALYDPENPPAALDAREDDDGLRPYTVIGYWNDEDEITITGIIRGEHGVFGGDGCSEGGPWATSFRAEDDEDAEMVAQDEATEAEHRERGEDDEDDEDDVGPALGDTITDWATRRGIDPDGPPGLIHGPRLGPTI